MPLTLLVNTVAECLRTDCYILGDKNKNNNNKKTIDRDSGCRYSLRERERERESTGWFKKIKLPLLKDRNVNVYGHEKYEGWNFNSGNYLFTTDTK